MKLKFTPLLLSAGVAMLQSPGVQSPGVQAAFLQGTDNTWTTTTTDLANDYWFADSDINGIDTGTVTWAANDGAVVTFGDNSGNVGRLFVGLNHGGFARSNGTLLLTSDSGTPGTFNLFGYHGSDQIVGRLGQGTTGYVGTITVGGGVNTTITTVPEPPGAATLGLLGILGLALLRRRRCRR